jgi:nucleotide-binding universal stress UspA family protein
VTFKRMLVGTDGSDSAMRAVEHASALAGKLGVELIVTHAYSKSQRPKESRERVSASYDIGASILRDASAWFREQATIRPLLREGPAADTLIATAREEGADLIVVGNRGLSTRQLLIGSVPARVAHQAPCTVLIVHTTDSLEDQPYARVLMATDGSPTATAAIAVGGELAAAVEADARVIHVGEEGQGARILEEASRLLPVRALGRTVTGDPARRIVEVAEEEGCDLIVIGNKGMTGARRFMASIPSKVARHARAHVLLVKTT